MASNTTQETARKWRKVDLKFSKASDVLDQYIEPTMHQRRCGTWKSGKCFEGFEDLVPRPEVDTCKAFELVPNCYGEDGRIHTLCPWSVLAKVFAYFVAEVGWVATHLMLSPYTRYGIIDEANIRQTLNTIVHPKHWSSTVEELGKSLPGLPVPFEPETEEETAMYFGNKFGPSKSDGDEAIEAYKKEKKVRKINATRGEKDPDHLIRAAADSGVYITKLYPDTCFAGFTGEIAADKTGFDKEKDDKEREDVFRYLRAVCEYGSRALFERLTPSDKAQIDSLLGRPGYSDFPALLEASVTGTGAEEFDTIFPQPPPAYRLDACAMIPYLHRYLMYERTVFSSSSNVLTPGAAVILNAAVSAVLYKAYQNEDKLEQGDKELESDDEQESESEEKENSAKGLQLENEDLKRQIEKLRDKEGDVEGLTRENADLKRRIEELKKEVEEKEGLKQQIEKLRKHIGCAYKELFED